MSGKVLAYQAAILEDWDNSSKPFSNNVDDKDRSAGWLSRALFAQLSRDVDLYARFATDRILFFWFAAVRSDYRERKVLSFDRVAYRTLMADIIRDNGPIGALRGYAFNRYVATKDWETIRSIDFKDFELPDGSRPLADVDLGGHRTARFVAQRIPSSLEKLENSKTSKRISKL